MHKPGIIAEFCIIRIDYQYSFCARVFSMLSKFDSFRCAGAGDTNKNRNPTSNMLNGDFVWDFSVTNTPPFKSGTARVCYTDEGFQSFFATE